jgi:phosphopantothenoylcysteine decarboxylase/phosphopantothenate--cysteine ligase
MNTLAQKRIVLGVTGSIAAYKSAELVRRLQEHGAEVRVVMTRAACEFITPLTMQALSGNPVHLEFLDADAEAAMGHIALARWCDVVLVAPASANFLAQLAHGQAGDLLSTLCLATTAPIMVAPAMNQQMWLNVATQENLNILQQRSINIIGPAEGEQACGEIGPGRLLEPEVLLHDVVKIFKSNLLTNIQLLVTAGPTREAIDPVRYISNRSSGRMGYAIARAAVEADAQVTLVSGPSALSPPEHVNFIQVQTAAQMRDAVMANVENMNIIIAVAAVADYRSAQVSNQKLKKKNNTISLTLEKTPDILAEITSLPRSPFTVGFAAETEQLKKNAMKKLSDKRLDMIAANQVGENLGFDNDENALSVFWPGGNINLEQAPKEKLARQLISVIAERYSGKNSTQMH